MSEEQPENKYMQLIREVFGNDKGQELLNLWSEIYVSRPSYVEGISTDEVLVREGERRFPSIIIEIMRNS